MGTSIKSDPIGVIPASEPGSCNGGVLKEFGRDTWGLKPGRLSPE
jgi:hypothetical protein